MKVCFLTTSYPSYEGHSRSVFLTELTRALAKKNVDVHVVCPLYKDSVAKEERWDGVHVHRFSYFIRRFQTLTESGGIEHFLKNPYLFFQLIFYLFAMFFATLRVSKDCDVIHCQWALSGMIGVIVGKIRNTKVIVTLRGQDVQALDKPFMRAIFGWTLRSADHITSNNESHLSRISSFISSFQLIRNGVDTERFAKRDKKNIRTRLHLPPGPLVLYVGRFVEVKGVSYLLDALPAIIKKIPRMQLVLIGDGPLRGELEQQAHRFHISDHISLLGELPCDALPDYYSAADALVLCSLSEGMPNVVLEAFASSLPVVATSVGGIPELIHDNVNGFLVPAKQPSYLADRITRLLQSSSLQQRFAKAGRDLLVKQQWTWERCAQQYIDLYKKV